MEENMLIEMPEIQGALVIVERATGIFYTTQAGGTRCAHPKVEGFIVPLSRYHGDVHKLSELTRDIWTKPGYFELPCTEEELSNLRTAVGEFLTEVPHGKVCLEHELLADVTWGEAWIPVVTPYGFGWLTWDNSD